MSQHNMIFAVLLTLVIANVASTYDCPEDCHCTVINSATPYNHAKCKSLTSLTDTKNLPIHSLDLSNANLTRVPWHQLEKLRDLMTIDLSHNELSEVGRLGRRVKTLNLKNNRITSGKLTRIPLNVQHLDLSNNELTYLPLDIKNLAKLRTIELTNNQINCTCDTLEVRNWLQEKHVYTQNPVRCTYPVEVKGKPWLQVRQSEICDHEKKAPQWVDDEDENELMLGDQPAIEGSAEDQNDEEELDKDFLPLNKKRSSKEFNPMDDVEGSGDLSVRSMPLNSLEAATVSHEILEPRHLVEDTTHTPYDADEGSGSGMGALNIPRIAIDNPEEDEEDEHISTSSPSELTTEGGVGIFGPGLGIAHFDDHSEIPEEVTEEPIVPVIFYKNNEDSPAHGSAELTTEDSFDSSEIAEADKVEKASIMVANDEKSDSQGTYFLLGVIALIVLGLVFYVGVKRCKSRDRNRSHDVENPRSTELLDMDKKNLGKPIQKNGNEYAPLIGEKKKEELAKPVNGNKRMSYENEKDKKTQEPLLNGDTKPAGESNNNVVAPEQPAQPTVTQPHQVDPPYDPNHRIIPRYPPPKSPRASKQNQQADGDDYQPVSPKMGRYSPVYSPETGKVKIKLTETPKPKTPMLVTRSKSNAGDIITTPIGVSSPASQNDVGDHQVPEVPPQQQAVQQEQ